MTQAYLTILGASLLSAGLVLALISFILISREGKFKGSGGAILLLGPIPIVIGSDKRTTLILLAVALLLIIIFAFEAFTSGV